MLGSLQHLAGQFREAGTCNHLGSFYPTGVWSAQTCSPGIQVATPGTARGHLAILTSSKYLLYSQSSQPMVPPSACVQHPGFDLTFERFPDVDFSGRSFDPVVAYRVGLHYDLNIHPIRIEL